MVGQIFRYIKPERPKPATAYIYTLNDPRTDEVRYVGRTARPQERVNAHITHCLSRNREGPRGLWIRELWAEGLTPYMVIIDEVPYAERWAAENKWAKYYHERGARLTIEPYELKRMGVLTEPADQPSAS